MNTGQSSCPCHPGETRDARFEYLDTLIRAGWGSVPMYLIERAIDENGGVLPLRPMLVHETGSNGMEPPTDAASRQ